MAESGGPSRKRVRFDSEELEKLKKQRFDDDDDEPVKSGPQKKHTLDSDEEDEGVEVKSMNPRKVGGFFASCYNFQLEGQEDATIEYDGDIKIMPFNMKEDMEEGYIDEDGAFVYKKEKEEIRDEWLDSVDWDGVKQKAGKNWHKDGEADDESQDGTKIDGIASCEKILEFLKTDKQTVSQVLKKINSEKNLSAAEERKLRWAAKKSGVPFSNPKSEEAQILTGAADAIISLGHMDAYNMNRQQILDIQEELEITRERAQRAERTRRAAEAAEKQRQKEDLIAALGDDDDDDEGGEDDDGDEEDEVLDPADQDQDMAEEVQETDEQD